MNSIEEWLQSVRLGEYTARFTDAEITVDVLPHLTAEDIDSLGLPIGPRRRLTVEVQRLAAAAHAETASQPVVAPPPAEPSAHAGERRQLTVMFCDLVGSTALAEHLDPEELLELMRTYRAVCTDIVNRYEGHVAQYLGDGLMVYFGWPAAHEDDAERGVRAALEMVRAVSDIRAARPLAVRIGIATGPVVVGDARNENAEARLAVGETPNLAARLQGLAGTNEVVIAPTTRRLVVDAFQLTDLGAHSLKGIAQPVQTWRVDDARRAEGRFRAAHGGRLAPLVGRQEESALLEECWDRARGGEGQVFLVGGQPGIGKSRLTQRLRERVGDGHTALTYQCSPYHLNSPLYPVIEQLEFSAGFVRDDPVEQRLRKLESVLVVENGRLEETAALMAALLSLPTDGYPPLNLTPRRQKEKTLEALVAQVAELSRRGPVLMMIEDIHWIDPTSQELIELLVPRVRELPVLLVMTHRLEYEPMWIGQPGVHAVTLNRLGRPEAAQLVETVTHGKALPSEVLDEILARTDGVPLFVEELTRSVLESGQLRERDDHYEMDGPLAALAIPVSLRDSLMARLDRLGPVKELAQIGACIGREFSYELLERVSTLRGAPLAASLETLAGAGLVSRRDDPPNATYTFKHALVQDAAYESLLRSRRSELHARIAQVLETDFADRVSHAPDWLAHHHTQAGHLLVAIPLWREAGTMAVARVALKEAIAHFQKGLTLIDQLPPSAERDALELSIREPLNAAYTGLRGWAVAEVGENGAAILRLAESQQNARSLLLARWWMWTSIITQGRIADSQPWVDRLLADGNASGDIDSRMFGHATAMVQHMLSGSLVASREHAELALALYDPRLAERWIQLTGHDLRTFVEVYLCQLVWVMGYPDQARRISEESNAHARTDGHAFSLVWALTFSAYVFAYRREPNSFLERVDEADQLARDQGLAFIYGVSVPQARGIAELQSGRPHEAVGLLRRGIESWTRVGGNVRVPYVKSALAEAVALDGDAAGAITLIDECLEQIGRPAWQERLWLAEVLRIKGWILSREGRDAEAETSLRAAIDCAREQQAKSWELRSSMTLASLLARTGRRDEARGVLEPVYAWFTEGHHTPDLVEAKALLATLSD